MITSENTYCYKCNLPHITITNAKTCECHLEVDSSHTDPIQKETAAVLKWMKRARVAEELNAIMLAALNEISKDRDRPLAECETSEMKAIEWERAYLYVTKRATTALNKCQEN